jgi:hypothetical protein
MQISSLQLATPGVIFLLLVVSSPLRTATLDQTVAPSISKNFDGPAELPREYVKSSLKDTPASGKTWMVASGQDLAQVLTSLSCGDVIQLQAGAAFSGNFVMPAKSCDDSHWIIIRTSAPDSSLPPEGTRLTPCFAGISGLPGRPRLNCVSTTNVLARIEFDGHGASGPITFSPGANHYRLLGLEVTRVPSAATVYNLIQFNGPADHVVFDRMWVHGTAQNETTRGILLGPSRYVAVVDSYFSDFHCIARSGSCTDAQTIAGGLSDEAMGPYQIVDNFLDAAGENILFGGGAAKATPTDIEIRRNHMFKPLTWMKGQAGFVGGTTGNPFIVKNLFELKNAQRVLVDGNILENSWGGFSQVGFGVLLTPVDQSGHCPTCQVTDVTIRYCSISHVAAGLQIANALTGTAGQGQRYSIHDIVIDDIDNKKYSGPGEFAQLTVSPGKPILQDVTINHVTAFPPRTLFIIGTLPGAQMKNFVFTNNIVNSGIYPVWSSGNVGGATNCAALNSPITTFNSCFIPYTFAGNVIIDPPALALPEKWPPGNFFPASPEAVRFVNYNGGIGGNYQLQSSSRYKGKATDGKDIGADVAAIASATAGVE